MSTLLLLLAISAGEHPVGGPCELHGHPGVHGQVPRGATASRRFYHFWAFHGPTWQPWYNYDYYRQFDYPWHDPRRREPPPAAWMQGPTRIRTIVGPPPPWLTPEFVPVEEVVPPAAPIEVIEPAQAATRPTRLRLRTQSVQPHDGGVRLSR
jgi:hypothetical protein